MFMPARIYWEARRYPPNGYHFERNVFHVPVLNVVCPLKAEHNFLIIMFLVGRTRPNGPPVPLRNYRTLFSRAWITA